MSRSNIADGKRTYIRVCGCGEVLEVTEDRRKYVLSALYTCTKGAKCR